MDEQSYMDEGLKKIIGEQITKLRTEILKLNQKEFAEMIGITQPTLSMYESGKAMPSLSTALTIALKGKVSIDWLCGTQIRLNTLSDVMACFFELYETEQFDIKTTLHNRVDIEDPDAIDDEDRNWVGLQVFYNDYSRDPKLKYSYDICAIIERVSNMQRDFRAYRMNQELYDTQKNYWIDYYKKNIITKENDHSGITNEEYIKRRDELADLAVMKRKKEEELRKKKAEDKRVKFY